MGVFSRIRRRPRGARVTAAAGLAALAVGGAVACQPGGLSTATVAYTTDRTATARLEQQHIDVSWLSCTGGDEGRTAGGTATGRTPSSTESTIISVDCQGRTEDGKDITVKGRITKAVDGACVRGDLVAAVDGTQRFHVNGLGDCSATPGPAHTPPATYRAPSGPRSAPTVTVTVTRTLWCQSDPGCRPVAGK
ncbi:hypothetical protein ACIQGO_03520 [Streptomyces shenzhenensis]|uniref:hypothetical protein n=1 Tax=Streptomyces shenzhenensis TaxID=943815 RepID=UPI0037F3BF69